MAERPATNREPAPGPPPDAGEGEGEVTVAVSRVIHPGHERDFAVWAQEVDEAARRFPGHLGSIRLQDADGVNHLVYRFDSPEHLRAWATSPTRERLLREGDRISDERHTTTTAAGAWFAIPGGSTRRWKAFVATWSAVYPTLLAITYTLTAVAPGLWRPVQLAIGSVLLTGALTWVIMPRVNRAARTWLRHGAAPALLDKPRPDAGPPAPPQDVSG